MSATAPAKPSTDLLFLFAQASHVLTIELTAALAELGISQRTYCVLSKAMSGELTQGQLAEACLLDKTTMVVTLDEAREGRLRRAPDVEYGSAGPCRGGDQGGSPRRRGGGQDRPRHLRRCACGASGLRARVRRGRSDAPGRGQIVVADALRASAAPQANAALKIYLFRDRLE
jgi:hypothetical protein